MILKTKITLTRKKIYNWVWNSQKLLFEQKTTLTSSMSSTGSMSSMNPTFGYHAGPIAAVKAAAVSATQQVKKQMVKW